MVLGDGAAGAARVRAALISAAATPQDQASALLLAGWLETTAGNLALAQEDLDEAGAIADQLHDDFLKADVQRHRAFLAIQQSLPEEALSAAAVSLATYRRSTLQWETAASLVLSAYGALMLGETAAATRSGEEAEGS